MVIYIKSLDCIWGMYINTQQTLAVFIIRMKWWGFQTPQAHLQRIVASEQRETGTSSAPVVPLCVRPIPPLFFTLLLPAGRGVLIIRYHPSNLDFVSGAGQTFWVTVLWCDSPGACLIGTRSCIRHKDKEGVIQVLLPQF